jgi:hypothetical protein
VNTHVADARDRTIGETPAEWSSRVARIARACAEDAQRQTHAAAASRVRSLQGIDRR